MRDQGKLRKRQKNFLRFAYNSEQSPISQSKFKESEIPDKRNDIFDGTKTYLGLTKALSTFKGEKMSTHIIGSLPSNGNAVIRNDSLTPTDSTDVFRFSINSTRNINLALTNISAGDDADLRLFRDINNNGILDATDRGVNNANAIGTSTRGGNADDSINLADRAAGTYFAEVSRYPTSSGNVSYRLGLSTADPSNLLPREVELGNLSRDVTQTGQVGNNDTADVYHFSLGLFEGVNIRLSGLSADADMRLIQDRNGNRIVDSGEVIRPSTNGGTSPESIPGINTSGDYYLEVYQYSGNTNYTLTFDHYNTLLPLTT